MQLSDRVTGLFIAALGGAAAYVGSRLPPVPGQQVGPSAFPTVVGLGLVACGVLVALGVGRSFEADATAEHTGSEGANAGEPSRGRHALWVAIPPALLVFYALASETLGFVPTAAAMVLVLALTFGGTLRLAIPLAAVAPVLVHLVFYKLLRVPLPPGLLPMPW